ncbi:MAG: NlpC/P60 family protein [Epsilonproteobacteria bacterium]|nr:MAG: NlpC/P60 family protein [Campylobacterota bacterium]
MNFRRFFALLIALLVLVLVSACAPKHRYKPVVKYQYPSRVALQKTLRGTYGDPYRYAGQGPNRFDCSGLTYYSFATMNLWLPRRAIDQSRRGKTISLSQLRYGDLIFFDTRKRFRRKVNHVGIYIGRGKFMHASSSKRRVITSSLYSSFYSKRIIVCKRMMR